MMRKAKECHREPGLDHMYYVCTLCVSDGTKAGQQGIGTPQIECGQATWRIGCLKNMHSPKVVGQALVPPRLAFP